jgi:hypothetical protein
VLFVHQLPFFENTKLGAAPAANQGKPDTTAGEPAVAGARNSPVADKFADASLLF